MLRGVERRSPNSNEIGQGTFRMVSGKKRCTGMCGKCHFVWRFDTVANDHSFRTHFSECIGQ